MSLLSRVQSRLSGTSENAASAVPVVNPEKGMITLSLDPKSGKVRVIKPTAKGIAQGGVGQSNSMTFGNYGNWGRFFFSQSGRDYRADIGDGSANSIVASVVRWISHNFAQSPLLVLHKTADSPKGEVVEGHALTELFEVPNAFYGGDLMLRAVIANLLVDGNGYLIKVRSASGRVIELWWAPYTMMEPHWPYNDPKVFIDYYLYSPGGRRIELPPSEVIHFRYDLDSTNIRKGRSPLKTALGEIYTDEEAQSYIADVLKNLGIPGVVISPDADADEDETNDEDLEAVKQGFIARFTGQHRGEPLVLPMRVKIEKLSFNPSEMDFAAIRHLPEERISAVFGLPAIVAGLGAGLERSTFANYQEARASAWEDNIVPLQKDLATEIKRQLLIDFEGKDPTFFCRFDTSEIPALADDKAKRLTTLDLGVKTGWASVADVRRAADLPVRPGDEVYLRGFSIQEVPADNDSLSEYPTTDEPPTPPAPPAPIAPTVEPLPDAGASPADTGAPADAAAGGGEAPKAHTGPVPTHKATHKPTAKDKARAKRMASANRAAIARVAPATEKAVRAYFSAFAKRVGKGAKASHIRLAYKDSLIRKDDAASRMAAAVDAIDWTEEEAELEDTLDSVYGEVGSAAFADLSSHLGTEIAWDTKSPFVKSVLGRVGNRVKGITDTDKDLLRAAVSDAVSGATSPSDLTALLTSTISGWSDSRAGTIALSETANAYNLSTTAGYRASGMVENNLVMDGDGCGWTEHDDPDEADGSERSLDDCDEYPESHPNCQRAFGAIVLTGDEGND
jgi:HK97 family phage portal protein